MPSFLWHIFFKHIDIKQLIMEAKSQLFFKALQFAAYRHRFSKTKNEEPYINHLINVCSLLVETGGISDSEILITGILHDILEKTNTKASELTVLFGEKITALILELSDLGSETEKEKWENQLKKIDKLNSGAKVIKLADKIENVRYILSYPPKGWDMERRIIYLDWSEKIINALRGTNIKLELYFDNLLATAKLNNPMISRSFQAKN